jgi:hypothetical protein
MKMGVIETEYLEIRNITKGIMSGAISTEQATILLKAYSESGKRVDQYLKVISMTINHGKSARQIINKNIISEGTAIDMGIQIEETFKCPAKGDILINRETCLDHSGDEKHIYFCQNKDNCEQFSVTRKQTCP